MDRPILKAPNELTNGELQEFERLVCEGGEVANNGLSVRIREARLLAFIEAGGVIVSVGALKNPRKTYVNRIARTSGYAGIKGYTLELGWVHTSKAHENRGYAKRICRNLMEQCGTLVFATTKVKNGAMRHILKKLGFKEVGKPWKSEKHPTEDLSLWICEPSHKTV